MLRPSFFRWWGSRRAPAQRIAQEQRPLRKPSLETLEDRVLPGMLLELSGLFAPLGTPLNAGLPSQWTNGPLTPPTPATPPPLVAPPQPPAPLYSPTASLSTFSTTPISQPSAPSTMTTAANDNAVFQSSLTNSGQPAAPTGTGSSSGSGNPLNSPFGPSSGGGSGYELLQPTAISNDTHIKGDNITSDTTLTLSGTGTAGLEFKVYEQQQLLGSGTVANDGTWSVALTGAFTDGAHALTLTNSTGKMLDVMAVTVDTTPPTVTIDAPEFTRIVRPTIHLGLSDGTTQMYYPEITIDFDVNHDGVIAGDGEIGYTTVNAGFGTASFQPLQDLEQGEYLIRASAMDYAGNVGVATATMEIDPNAGYIRSADLLQLLRDDVQNPASSSYQQQIDWIKLIGPEYVDFGGSLGGSMPGSGGGMPGLPGGGMPGGGMPGSGGALPGSGGMGGTGGTGDTQSGDQTGTVALTWAGKKNVYAQVMNGDPARDALFLDDQNRVLVNARVTKIRYLQQYEAALTNLGMDVTTVRNDGIVVGWLPIDKIDEVVDVPHFYTLTSNYKPVLNVGSADNQGDPLIGGPQFRSSQNVDGTGVKVGVLSDSVDRLAGGLSDSVGTGDLPAGVQVIQDGPAGGSDEGRAMLEIVHDLAPGASLAFATAFVGGPSGFANNIRALAAAGSNVIVDDVLYFNSPRFNDGVVSQAVEDVTNAGVFYATSANNLGDQAYLAPWAGTNGNIGGGALTGTFHAFAGGDILQNITIPVGGAVRLFVTWDAAYLEGGSALPNFAVPNDVDIFITDASGANILANGSNAVNPTTREAYEFITYANPSGSVTDYALAIHLASGPAPTRISWVSFPGFDDPMAQGQGAPASLGHELAKGGMTVGAVVSSFSGPVPDVHESFSAQGGANEIMFDRAGNRLGSPEIRIRPQVAAPDGVNTSFFGGDVPFDTDSLPNFYGTSAAAPQVAGAAALIIQQARFDIAPDELVEHFMDTAIDVDAPGFDVYTGAGRINLEPFVRVTSPGAIEPNETSAEAAFLGGVGESSQIRGLSIRLHDDGLPDYDWFRWSAAYSGTFSASIKVKSGGGTLELTIWTLDGRALNQVSGTAASGGSSATATAGVSAFQQIFVGVKGQESVLGIMDEGNYELTVQIQ